MRMSRRGITLLTSSVLSVLAAALFVLVRAHSSPTLLYKGKPLAFWCDRLPFTAQFPIAIAPDGFARCGASSSNPEEERRFRKMEQQSLLAIATLGTNCLPELLKCFREKTSPLASKIRYQAARIGLVK